MTRYLVTGAAGFIGSHVVYDLLRSGFDVIGLDNMFSGHMKNVEVSQGYIDSGSYLFVEGDIRDMDLIYELCDRCTHIVHLAALGSVPRSWVKIKETTSTNVDGTALLLNVATMQKIKRFVFASSSSVYGEQPIGKVKIETMIPRPLSPYAMTKFFGEQLCEFYERTHGLSCVSLRFFNVFGPRQNPEGEYAAVIPRFIHLMLKEQQPVIFGTGRQTRDFTYIDNVVKAIRLALDVQTLVPGRVFNVSTGESISIQSLAETIGEYLDFAVSPKYSRARNGDVIDSDSSTALARTWLGYGPVTDFHVGLEETIEWFKREYA